MDEFVNKKTTEGNKPQIRCSRIQTNRMQCPRNAAVKRADDPTGREALCYICYALSGKPKEYEVFAPEIKQ